MSSRRLGGYSSCTLIKSEWGSGRSLRPVTGRLERARDHCDYSDCPLATGDGQWLHARELHLGSAGHCRGAVPRAAGQRATRRLTSDLRAAGCATDARPVACCPVQVALVHFTTATPASTAAEAMTMRMPNGSPSSSDPRITAITGL